MIFSRETDQRINTLFKNDPKMRESLFDCDAEAIREVGFMAQTKIEPEDVIDGIKSNDPEVLNYLLGKAEKLVEMKILYQEMCYEYYKKMKATDDNTNEVNKTL